MDKRNVEVRFFGTFSISYNGKTISDRQNRSTGLWLLLAYLIQKRSEEVTSDELFGLIWGDGDGSTNPANALKTMFHRLRSMLDTLEEGFGKAFLTRSGHCYRVSPDFALSVDTEDFENLFSYAAELTDENARLNCLIRACELYRGHFAPKLSSEFTHALAERYRTLYAKAAREAADILSAQGRSAELESLCRRAILLVNEEFIYLHLCRSLLGRGKKQAVMDIFNTYSNTLYSEYGTLPSDELRALYREASKTSNERILDIDGLASRLREAESSPGAYICDYDFFEAVYRAEARAMTRSGAQSHIVLLSATDSKGAPLARRSLDICMDNLDDIIRLSLRKGDVAAKCSISQYIILLPATGFSNICDIIERIIKRFDRQYPHSPARLRYSICPVEPNK